MMPVINIDFKKQLAKQMTLLTGHVYPVLTSQPRCKKNASHPIWNVMDTSIVEQDFFRMKRDVLSQHRAIVRIAYVNSNPLKLPTYSFKSFKQRHQHSVARHSGSRSTSHFMPDGKHGVFLPPAQSTTSPREKSRRLPSRINLTHTSSCRRR
jgi:hypothetical protein